MMRSPHRRLRTAFLAVAALVPAATSSPAEDGIDRPAVRLLPPVGAVAGPTNIEVLAIDREIATVVFYVDGEEVAERKKPPWLAKLPLGAPAREQKISVVAFDPQDRQVGRDVIVVNRATPPLAVRIETIEGDAAAGPVTVRAKVSVPRKARLAALRFYRNDTLVATRTGEPYAAKLAAEGAPTAEDLVRVELELADGRTVEDVAFLAAPGVIERVDVNLVQLQALVTTKRGAPVTDLAKDDFVIRQNGQEQTVDRLYLSQDLALVLGLVIDASGSMGPVWDLTLDAVRRLLGSTIGDRDRAFIIDFDTELRLSQPLTGSHGELAAALDDLSPFGNTALFDAILYGLLQYADEPGRRALVVVTDGLDSGSLADPDRILDVANRLGVPVYVVAVPFAGLRGGGSGLAQQVGNVVHTLKLITDPSGGRLIRVQGNEGLARAFAQIALEMRSQYVLTYYTDAPPTDGVRAVDIDVPGRKGLDVRAVLPLDQVQ